MYLYFSMVTIEIVLRNSIALRNSAASSSKWSHTQEYVGKTSWTQEKKKHTTLGSVGVEVDEGEIGGRYEDKIIRLYKILQLKNILNKEVKTQQ